MASALGEMEVASGCVRRNALTDGILPAGITPARMKWQRRVGSALQTRSVRFGAGQEEAAVEGKDIPAAICKLLGEAAAGFFDAHAEAIGQLLDRCGCGRGPLEDARAAVAAQASAEREALVQFGILPRLNGGPELRPRLARHITTDHSIVVVSIYDVLDWLRLDSHHVWHNWLHTAVTNWVSEEANNRVLDSEGARSPPVLTEHKFGAHLVPMVCSRTLRRIIALLVRRCDLPEGIIDSAIEVPIVFIKTTTPAVMYSLRI